MKFKRIKVILSIVIATFFSQTSGNEIGISTGMNSSFYHSWYSQKSEFQKNVIFSPVEIYFRSHFNRFFGLHSALQFTKQSISESYSRTDVQGNRIGKVTSEISYNFISVQVCPFLFHKFTKVTADVQAGLNSDIYINQWATFDGDENTYRDKNVHPVMLSLVAGCGVNYSFRSHFVVGVRSRISRTVTSFYKQRFDDDRVHFVNWYTVFFAGFEF